MTTKTCTHAGISRDPSGKLKMRWANDIMRVKILTKEGHTDVDIVELRHTMQRMEAVQYLISINFANGNPEIEQLLADELIKRSDKPAKEPKAKKAEKPTMEGITAKVAKIKTAPEVAADASTEDENAPF